MLYSLEDTRNPVQEIPHQKEYRIWRGNISDSDYEAIVDHLDSLIEGTEVQTSSWIPGSDWTGTPFEPIYHACRFDVNAAAQFYGLILWDVMMRRADHWSFSRYEKDGIPIRGLTYFRIYP